MPFHAQFQTHINELANAHQAPHFEPHMTLFCGGTHDMNKTISDIASLVSDLEKMSLTATAVEATEQYYKSLFVQFKTDPQLTNLSETIKKKVDTNSQYKINPHLSLLYKDMPLEQKRKLTNVAWDKVLDYIPANKTLMFDTIKLMSDTEEEGPEAVKSWKTIKTFYLSQ